MLPFLFVVCMECLSSYILLQAYQLFSNAYGMKANAQKFAFYSCVMSEEDMQKIQDVRLWV